MKYTKAIAIKTILKGACKIFKIGIDISKFSQNDLFWYSENIQKSINGIPVWCYSNSGYGDGSGSGSGSGSGYGDGSGSGSGFGDGSGYGSGFGNGSGSGAGYGDGVITKIIKLIKGEK